MALLTSNNTGNVWPGELESGRIDAPAVQYSVDPTLPILGSDKKFESDQIVIGRGRLIGLKNNASVVNGAISQTDPHVNYITVANGTTVAPLGYADQAIYRDWAAKANGTMPKIARNYMINVPFVNGVNNLYGALAQGDKVTALASIDPRLTGSIVKFVGRQVVTLTGITATAGATTIPAALPQPVVLMGSKTTALVVDPKIVWSKVAGFWNILSTTAAADTAVVSYGFGAEMIAGEVYGLETNTDLPGFLKWVEDNFGAWQVYPYFAALGNSANAATTAPVFLSDGYMAIKGVTATNTAVPVRIDPRKEIVVSIVANKDVYVYNKVSGVYENKKNAAAAVPLNKAQFSGADNTQGENYTVDPTTGIISYFGLASDDAGTALTESLVEANLLVTYSLEAISPEPAFGSGLIGTSPNGIPSQYLKDPVTGAAAIGILKVAIH